MGDNRKVSGKVTSKGQVTIPIEVRKAMNLEEGDRLEFVREEGGGYSVQAVKKKSVTDVFGILQTDKPLPDDFNEVRETMHEHAGKHYAQSDLDEENYR